MSKYICYCFLFIFVNASK